MFKKLKDKITEEVNQASLRLPSTVQQLSQYSPFNRDGLLDGNGKEGPGLGLSNNKQPLVDFSDGASQFSLAEEDENSPQKQQSFQTVDLSDKGVIPRTNRGSLSRQSSLSSIISEPPLFSYYESPANAYNLQSDLESTASEFEDSSPDLTLISKEQLFTVCQKTRARYHKYKGRYSDLAKHYRELERETEKIKTILTESQDKALRRLAELREQCQLEQQAKAHLEENLRSDLEEKDSLINVLNTKITWLKEGKKLEDDKEVAEEKLVDIRGEAPLVPENPELAAQKARITELEGLLHKCKEHIKNQKERSLNLQKEKQDLETRVNELEASNASQLSELTENLTLARVEIEALRKQEQETSLGIAQTQQRLAGELEAKEGQVQKLWGQIKDLEAEKTQFKSHVAELETGLEKLKDERVDFEANVEEERQRVCQEMSRGKMEALRLLQEDMDKKFSDVEEEKEKLLRETEEAKRLEAEAQRALRLQEEEHHKVLTELNEESKVALEAQNMEFGTKLAQQDSELCSLQSDLNDRQNKFEKLKEELVSERQDWVRQIEDNRTRHLQELEAVRGTLAEALGNREHLEKKFQELQTVLEEKEAMVREFAQNGEVETIRQKQLEGLEKRVSDLMEERDNSQRNLLEAERLLEEKSELLAQLPALEEFQSLSGKTAALESEKAHFSQLLNNTIGEQRVQAAESVKESEELKTQLKNWELELKGSHKRLFDTEDQLRLLQQALEEKEKTIVELSSKCESLDKSIEAKSSQVIGLEQKLVQTEAQFEALRNQHQVLEGQCQQLNEGNESEKRRVKELEEELQRTLANLEDKQAEFLAKERDLGADVQELAVYKKTVLDLQSRVELQLTESEKYIESIQRLELELSDAQRFNDALTAAKSELELSVEDARVAEELSKQQVTGLENEVGQLRSDLANLRESEVLLRDHLSKEETLAKKFQEQLQALKQDTLNMESHFELKIQTYETDLKQLQMLRKELETSLQAEERTKKELELRLADSSEINKTVRALQDEIATLKDSQASLEIAVKAKRVYELEATQLKQTLKDEESTRSRVQADVTALQSEVDSLKSEHAGITAQLEKEIEKSSALQSSVRIFEERQAELDKELKGKKEKVSNLQKRVSELQKDFSLVKDKNVQLEKDLLHNTTALETAQKNCETLKKGLREKSKVDEKVKQLESQLQEALAAKQALEERCGGLEKVLAAEKEKVDSASQEVLHIQALLKEKDKSSAEAADMLKELHDIRAAMSHVEGQLKESQQLTLSLESVLQEKETALRELRESQNGQKESCKELEERCLQLQCDLSDVHTDKSKLETLCKKMKAQMLEMRKNAEEKDRGGDGQVKEVEEKHNKELERLKDRYEREAADLRQIIDVRNKYSPLEEATELEYLRNILYEYMMGRQPTILAKVIAAIVKFTNEQTQTVLLREEQRQTLLGQLGFV